jgi:hypothetical protein
VVALHPVLGLGAGLGAVFGALIWFDLRRRKPQPDPLILYLIVGAILGVVAAVFAPIFLFAIYPH